MELILCNCRKGLVEEPNVFQEIVAAQPLKDKIPSEVAKESPKIYRISPQGSLIPRRPPSKVMLDYLMFVNQPRADCQLGTELTLSCLKAVK